MIRKIKIVLALGIGLLMIGCVPMPSKDYTKFREIDPQSILVVPVVNRSVDVDAPDYFLSTISRPVAERGYYVFPVNLVKRLLEDEGLSDAFLVHTSDPTRLAEMFDCDAIFYVTIERWDARYAVFSTTVTVEFTYLMKSGETGEELWRHKEKMVYSPQQQSSGDPLAGLCVAAIHAAIAKAFPNYIPLTQQANANAVTRPHDGLPAGPYAKEYGKDLDKF